MQAIAGAGCLPNQPLQAAFIEGIPTHTRAKRHPSRQVFRIASPRCVSSMCMLAGDCKCFCYLLSFAAAAAAVPVELSAFAHAAACAYCCKRSLRCIWFLACPINLVRMLTSRCCNCTSKVKAMRSCCHCRDQSDLVKGQEASLPQANQFTSAAARNIQPRVLFLPMLPK